jgi:hypothetical protein
MSIDALFQLGIVSVVLNTTQTEERISRLLRRFKIGPLADHSRRIGNPDAITAKVPQRCLVLPYTIQTQDYSGRTPI